MNKEFVCVCLVFFIFFFSFGKLEYGCENRHRTISPLSLACDKTAVKIRPDAWSRHLVSGSLNHDRLTCYILHCYLWPKKRRIFSLLAGHFSSVECFCWKMWFLKSLIIHVRILNEQKRLIATDTLFFATQSLCAHTHYGKHVYRSFSQAFKGQFVWLSA